MRRYTLGINGVGSDIPKKASAVEDGLRAVSLRLDTNSIRLNSFGPTHQPYSPPLSPTALPTPSSEASEVSDYTFSDDDAASSISSPPSSNSASPMMRPTQRKNDSISSISLSPPFLSTEDDLAVTKPLPFIKLLVLMSRLYEAHFNIGFFFMFITVSPWFNPGLHPMPLWKLHDGAASGLLPDLPKAVLFATSIASHLGTLAFICTAAIFYNYERFHHVTTTKRWENQTHLGKRAHQQTIRYMPWCMLNYAGLPFTIVFGVIPLFQSVTFATLTRSNTDF